MITSGRFLEMTVASAASLALPDPSRLLPQFHFPNDQVLLKQNRLAR